MMPAAIVSTWRALGGMAVGVILFGLLFALALALGEARREGPR